MSVSEGEQSFSLLSRVKNFVKVDCFKNDLKELQHISYEIAHTLAHSQIRNEFAVVKSLVVCSC